jgi:hypothetical protein
MNHIIDDALALWDAIAAPVAKLPSEHAKRSPRRKS